MPAATKKTSRDLHPIACWLDADQVELVKAVCERAGLEVVAAGSAQLGRVRELAGALAKDAKAIDDFRALLTNPDAGAILLCAPPPGEMAGSVAMAGQSEGDGASPGATGDAALWADCRARGVPIFSFEPIPAGLLQMDTPTLVSHEEPILALGPDAMSGRSNPQAGITSADLGVEFCPLLRTSRAVREAVEILPQLGNVHAVHVESWSGVGQGSLGARLFDAIDAVTSLLGLPDRIDAAFVSPGRGRGVHELPGDSLRVLDGEFTANMRFADGRAAALVCSSRAGRFNRSMTIVADGGRLRTFDDGFVWIDPSGKTVDSSRDSKRIRGGDVDPETHAIAAIAEQLARRLDPAMPADAPTDLVRALAACGAALLSARTGESESPATIMRMVRAR